MVGMGVLTLSDRGFGMKMSISAVACTVLALAGCAQPVTHGPIQGDAVPAAVRVIAQLCVPIGVDRNFISVQTVTAYSVGGGGQKLTGRTSSSQAVFEFFTAHPNELRAILVRFPNSDGSWTDHFVYRPPNHIEFDSWSVWEQATAIAKDGNWGVGTGMVNGERPAVRAVPAGSPVMRYRLMPFEHYLEGVGRRRDNGLDMNISRCEADGGRLVEPSGLPTGS